MLRLGKSKPWKEVMEIMTGTPKMDTGAYREYFAPLEKWLIKKNKEENNKVGLGFWLWDCSIKTKKYTHCYMSMVV